MTAQPLLAALQALRDDPARVPDAAALAELAGMTPEALGALCLLHRQRTPEAEIRAARIAAACRRLAAGDAPGADLADAVGCTSAAAFADAFRAETRLTPAAYAEMLATSRCALDLPEDYRPADALAYHGRDAQSLGERVEGSGFAKALLLGETPAVLSIRFADGQARMAVETAAPPSAGAHAEAHAKALRLLGLAIDPAGLAERAEDDPQTARLIAGRPGLRLPLTGDIFESFVWAIVGQQVNLPFAYTLRRRVVAAAGLPAPGGLTAPPKPEAVAALPPDLLTAQQFSRRKAEYLIAGAGLVAAGALPIEGFPAGSAVEAMERLLAVRGIGPWTAQYVLLRGCGFGDCVPIGDAGLTAALQRFHHLPARPDAAETAALMAAFAPHRSLATAHLWASLSEPTP
ncbi:MAG TPA: helix-turn-helix domain-containing protein [Alphaproteobacteria bacterium]|nr:helix-turn-helix domain-containing protein [Alphaproteobacteria bacterium]